MCIITVVNIHDIYMEFRYETRNQEKNKEIWLLTGSCQVAADNCRTRYSELLYPDVHHTTQFRSFQIVFDAFAFLKSLKPKTTKKHLQDRSGEKSK